MNIPVKVIRRPIKHPRIEIKNFETRIILPDDYNVPVDRILNKYRQVLDEKYKYINEVKNLSKTLKIYKNNNFKRDIIKYVEEFSKELNVKPVKIIFRKMKKRWASCSKDGKLIFNKNLMYLPKNLVRYVVCHEVCHLVERKHNRNFYELVGKFCKGDNNCFMKLLDSYLIFFISEDVTVGQFS